MKTQIDIEKAILIIKRSGVFEKSSKREMVHKKIFTAVFLREHTSFTMSKICNYLGVQERSTIFNYLKKYNSLKENSLFKSNTKGISIRLNNCLPIKDKKINKVTEIKINLDKVFKIIKESEICKITRKRNIVYKRAYAAVFLRKNTRLTLSEIGYYLGGKDHCVILHYLKTYENFKDDSLFKMYTKEISDQLNDCFISQEKKSNLNWLEYAVINCVSIKELREIQMKVLNRVDNNTENYFEMEEMLTLVK